MSRVGMTGAEALGRDAVKRILDALVEEGVMHLEARPCMRNGYVVPAAAHYRLAGS